ncbi:MAG: alanine--tRNA ligase [Planctomycetes bacterium]|nr:alanine--tRNA ligase [Planctomycetota bacterium]
MSTVNHIEVRDRFLKFFDRKFREWAKAKGEDPAKLPQMILPAYSLVPDDPSTLFTTSGMHQFKDDFTGNLKHGTKRATTCQKCMRTPDLENVGKTARHHTMFEMLGFFSFGDYFKKEAIAWIWEFYTVEMKLSKDKLRISVYQDDNEAYELWAKLEPSLKQKNWIYRFGENDNFWPAGSPSQGPNGVCGPCSEIFYDLGASYDKPTLNGADDPSNNGDRFMEIGNIVFTQFERSGPIPGKGTLTPLPAKNIDFGGGLERLIVALENVPTTLDTSLFTPVREKMRALLGKPAPQVGGDENVREKRIADHIRASTFLIADGVVPSNEKQGYVLRRVLRRAYRDGNKLGFKGPFLHKLARPIIDTFGDVPDYRNLKENPAAIEGAIKQEEEAFDKVLARGLEKVNALIADLKKRGQKVLDGALAFDLHSTYGLPVDVTRDELTEAGFTLDEPGFEAAFDKFREDSRKAGGFSGEVFDKGWFAQLKAKARPTEFLGYQTSRAAGNVVGISHNENLVDYIREGSTATVILDKTPFYGESGGQVGDSGVLQLPGGKFIVADTKKKEDYILHVGKLESGKLSTSDTVEAIVDDARRTQIRANHSATHLMHAALRKVLGEHVVQRGSEVASDRLRFDFTHTKPVSWDERREIERIVNEQIVHNADVCTDIMSPDKAREAGAMALFGEKYGDRVRVLSMGSMSDVPSDGSAGFQPAKGALDIRDRGYLPHWEKLGATYFVTFRLDDSLPESVRKALEFERKDIVLTAEQVGRPLSESELDRLDHLYSEKMEDVLNAGHGACHLRRADCAKIVSDAFKHFDKKRYDLFAWVVMPNHVHVVFCPYDGEKLADIMHSWKSFTAKECNKVLGREGIFWQPEYFDRLIRNKAEFARKVTYVEQNPVVAKLGNWDWVWTFEMQAAGTAALPAGQRPANSETPATPAGLRPTSRAAETATSQRPFSRELCGGTHVRRTGDIGLFKIVSEGSSAAGVRRIEAVTGMRAVNAMQAESDVIAQLGALLKTPPDKVLARVEAMQKENRELKSAGPKSAGIDAGALEKLRTGAQTVGGAKVIVAELPVGDAAELLTIMESLRQDAPPHAVLLGGKAEDKAMLVVGFSPELVKRGLHAGKLIGEIAKLVGGGGGGKPEHAQAGGKNPQGLPEALKLGQERILKALS